jgi:hypothetical protein
MEGKVKEYKTRLRERVGEGEYERHKELVILLARNLAIEDVLWEEILVHIRNIDLRTKLLRERNQIVRDIHTEFRALSIEIPSVIESKSEAFMEFLGDLDASEGRDEGTEGSDNGNE